MSVSKLCEFPCGEPGAVPVYQVDVDTLSYGTWLNDQIVGKNTTTTKCL